MTAIQAIEELNQLSLEEPEDAHSGAEEVLIAFLKDHDPACRDVAEAFEALRRDVHFRYL